jgi:hypothetical protein
LANVLSAAQRGAGAPRFIVGAPRFIVGALRFIVGVLRFIVGALRFIVGALRFIVGALRFIVMAGLVPAIHVFLTLGNLRQIRDRGFSGLHDRAACV